MITSHTNSLTEASVFRQAVCLGKKSLGGFVLRLLQRVICTMTTFCNLVTLKTKQPTKGEIAVNEAAAYLRSCGIRLPRFKLTAEPPEKWFAFGGSYVNGGMTGSLRLNMGTYPTKFLRNWFAMHELGHVLWHLHRPLRWKKFRTEFGEPMPPDYDEVHKRESFKTVSLGKKLSWMPGKPRPHGEPSWYGARGGGEERFCELIGLMYAHGDFSQSPPADLAELWDTCWSQGLARMT